MQICNDNVEAAINWIVEHGLEIEQNASSRESSDFVFVNEDLKMVCLVRADLEMSSGKVAAQCVHACLGAYRRSRNDAILVQWESTGDTLPLSPRNVMSEAPIHRLDHRVAITCTSRGDITLEWRLPDVT